MLALTRARVVWASEGAFANEIDAAIEAALRRPRPARAVAKDVREMRALLERERPPSGFWDVKLSKGGLVDVEFTAQYLQLAHAADAGPLRASTVEALKAFGESGLIDPARLSALLEAWTVQQDLSQLLKVALPDDADPSAEPEPLRVLLAEAGGARTFKQLQEKVKSARLAARQAFEAVVVQPQR
jgi:glutamate-ammonia-ligase adenylyltransferase